MARTPRVKTHIVGPFDEVMCGVGYHGLLPVTPDAEGSNCKSCVRNLRKRYSSFIAQNETLLSVRDVQGGFVFRRRGPKFGKEAYVCPVFEFTKITKERRVVRELKVMDTLEYTEAPYFACQTGVLAAEEIENNIRANFYEKKQKAA